MSFFRRLLHWERPSPEADADAADLDSAPAGISFRELVHQLDAPDAGARAEAALLLSALGQPAAIQPLVRSWVRHGDDAVAVALGTFGSRVTPVAARAVRDLSQSASQRARAIHLLGRLADPAARAALRAAAVDPDPVVHIAADVALVQVDDPVGAEYLTRGLAVRPPAWRAEALRALRTANHPAARALAEDHIARYLAEGGAVPGDVEVALPLLIDTETDLARRIGRYVAQAPEPFVLVTGPGTADLAERQRETLRAGLGGRRLFFTTARHSPPEQVDVLRAARAATVSHDAGVVHIGPVPDPGGLYEPPDFLAERLRPDDSAFVVHVGPQSLAVVVAWWHFLAERAAVPTRLSVVLTALTLSGTQLGDEAWEIYQRTLDGRGDAFARAYLAHLPEPP